MLNTPASDPSSNSEDRESRIRAVMDRLRPAAEQALRQMAEELVDAPDRQLFGGLELRLRDHAQQLAATVHQTGLQDREKGATAVPASPVPAV
jgi:hypothetical protein